MVCLTHIWSFLLSLWDIKGYWMISTSLMETAIITLYNILPLILFESMASALCSFSLHISACLSFPTCNPGTLKLTASHHGRACLRQDLSLFYIRHHSRIPGSAATAHCYHGSLFQHNWGLTALGNFVSASCMEKT